MKPRPQSERGDTLVEVIVSIVILAIVAAGLLAGMSTTTASSNIGRQQADAEALLTSVGEAVKDPTQFPYDCSGQYDVQKLAPAGWIANVVNTPTLERHDVRGRGLVLYATNAGAHDPGPKPRRSHLVEAYRQRRNPDEPPRIGGRFHPR